MAFAGSAAPTLPVETRTAVLRRLRRFAHLMDDALDVPLLNVRIGLDPLLGLIPVIGDAAGSVLALYVPAEAIRLGAPWKLVGQMLFNIAIEFFIGAVPIVGDYLDAIWKASQRNVALLEEWIG